MVNGTCGESLAKIVRVLEVSMNAIENTIHSAMASEFAYVCFQSKGTSTGKTVFYLSLLLINTFFACRPYIQNDGPMCARPFRPRDGDMCPSQLMDTAPPEPAARPGAISSMSLFRETKGKHNKSFHSRDERKAEKGKKKREK